MGVPVRLLRSYRDDYDERFTQLADLLYRGGREILRAKAQFVQRNPVETEEWYRARLETFYYVNRIAQVVNEYAGTVFQTQAQLQPKASPGAQASSVPEFYSDLFLHPTRSTDGPDLNALLLSRLKRALIDRRAWVLVDFPVLLDERGEPARFEDRATQESAGALDAKLVPIDDAEVINFSEDDRGLSAVMLYRCTRQWEPLSEHGGEDLHVWTLIDRTTSRRFECRKVIGERIEDGDEAQEITSRPHLLADRGLVPMARIELDHDVWLVDHLIPIVLQETRERHDLAWYKRLSCIPQLTHAGAEELTRLEGMETPGAERLNQKRGPQYVWEIGPRNEGNDLFWLEVGGTPLEILEEGIDRLRQESMRIVCNMAAATGPGAAAQIQSAASKVRDSIAKRVLCAHYAQAVRRLAAQTIDLVSMARGDAERWNVIGLDQHDVPDLEALSAVATQWLAAGVPSATGNRELIKQIWNQALPGADARLIEKIRAEVDASSEIDRDRDIAIP